MAVRRQPDPKGACGSGLGQVRVLFVCARNRLRSRTAEAIFSGMNGLEVSSAGTAPDAECPVSTDLLEWADLIFVMETKQRAQIAKRFAEAVREKTVVVLGIPDRFRYMQAELISELRAKVMPWLAAVVKG